MKIEKAIDNLNYIKNNDFNRNIKQHKRIGVNSIDLAISALEKQLNSGWIPVSERFPKENDIYLVTFEEQEKRYVERLYFSTMNGWYMPLVWQDEGKIEKIIAWQPLPEPYKEVENE